MQFSHSRVECFKNCPYQFKLRYIDNLKTLDEYEPQDALKLGTAVHTGIQVDVDTAIKDYFMSYPIITDKHVDEAIKIEMMCNKARAILPLDMSEFEVPLHDKTFTGFIDMLTIHEDGKVFDIYDFKYSNNIDKYLESPQLSIYKYYAEKILGIKVDKLYFVFLQKVGIRQRKTETQVQFRTRLRETLKDAKVQIVEVPYNENHVLEFMHQQEIITEAVDYPKNQTRLCDWCSYQSFCEKGEDLDMLPSTSRVEVKKNDFKKLWIYGQPFTGKTTFADKAPTPLNLNTDGNVKYVTMPRLPIADEITVDGRLTNRKYAWEVFKEAIAELERGSDFETIVVDLVEDTFDHARIKTCDDNGWSHESDDSFKAYEITRNEFLRTMKRLLNLPYNIILISHEDTSIDIMKKGGDKITSIRPNINEKVAKKLAGMVDLVGRVVADDGKRTLTFKEDEIVFGGGRLQGVKTMEIPLDWNALCAVYNEATGIKAPVEEVEETPKQEPQTQQEEVVEEAPKKRTRRSRN